MPSTDVTSELSYHNMNDGGTPTSNVFKSMTRRQRNWTNTANYPIVPRDDLPVNAYTDHKWSTLQNPVVHALTYKSGVLTSHVHSGDFTQAGADTEYTNMVAQVYTQHGIDTNAMLNAATVKAAVKVADAKVNVAVTLAEAAKTSDLILGTANRIYRAYRSFRRGDVVGIASNLNITPRKLHKSWLEYKYGWIPLLMDVKNGAEFFAQQHLGRPVRFVVSATEEVVASYGYTEDLSSFKPGSSRVRYTTISCKAKVKIWCELSNPHLSAVQQLGLTNPALVAWELVPFSFVFDWFISVGDYLQALSAFHGVTVRRAMGSTVKTASGYRDTRIAARTVGSTYEAPYQNTLAFTGRAYTRAARSVDPTSLYPPVNNPFTSWQKAVTALALLRATTRGFGYSRV